MEENKADFEKACNDFILDYESVEKHFTGKRWDFWYTSEDGFYIYYEVGNPNNTYKLPVR